MALLRVHEKLFNVSLFLRSTTMLIGVGIRVRVREWVGVKVRIRHLLD